MKKNYMLNIVVGFVMLFSVSSLYAVDTTLPKGKPFVKINEEIVEVQAIVSTLQDQVDSLMLSVNTFEERQVALENALSEANNDIVANSELISVLQSELDNVKEMIEISNHIANKTCPEGQAFVDYTDGVLSCSTANSFPELSTYNVYAYTYVPPRSADNDWSYVRASAFCNKGDVVTGGGFVKQNTHIQIRSSRGSVIQNSPELPPQGVWTVIADNFSDFFGSYIHSQAFCLKGTWPN